MKVGVVGGSAWLWAGKGNVFFSKRCSSPGLNYLTSSTLAKWLDIIRPNVKPNDHIWNLQSRPVQQQVRMLPSTTAVTCRHTCLTRQQGMIKKQYVSSLRA